MQLREVQALPRPLLEQQITSLYYPVAALGDLLGPAVERMPDVIGVCCAMAAQSVLATAALARQAHANVHLDGRIYPLSLYLLTVACSGDCKSALDHIALQAVLDWERQQWIVYGEQLKAHRAAVSLTAKSPTSKKSAQLELDAQPEPVQPRLLTAEPTIEGMVKSLCHGLPSMGLFSDEGGQFLGGSTMSKDNMIKTITHLSTLWDGSPIDRSRAVAGESLRAYDRRLSMHLMLQPRIADRLLQEADIKDQGILGRCLISWPERLVGQRLYKAIDLTRDPNVQLYQQRIAALMQKPWSRHTDGGLTPAVIKLSSRAREAWIAIHDTIECESGELGELVNVQAAASKAAANVLRMAGVMAVVEESTVLEDLHIQRASTLMDYYLAENQRLTEQEPLSKLRAEADCLLRWLIKKNWPPFRLRDLTRNGPRFARKSTRHTFELLLQLVAHNWLDNDGDIFEVRHVPTQ